MGLEQGTALVTGASAGIRRALAEEVARVGYRGLANGEVIVVPGTSNELTRLVAKLLPSSVARRLAMRMNR